MEYSELVHDLMTNPIYPIWVVCIGVISYLGVMLWGDLTLLKKRQPKEDESIWDKYPNTFKGLKTLFLSIIPKLLKRKQKK